MCRVLSRTVAWSLRCYHYLCYDERFLSYQLFIDENSGGACVVAKEKKKINESKLTRLVSFISRSRTIDHSYLSS